MTDFKIEHGVPVPTTVRPTMTSWPWPKLGDGDSILIPEDARKKAQASAAAWLKRQRPGWRAVSRAVGGGNARVWFVAPKEENEKKEKEEAPDVPEGVTQTSVEDAVENIEPPA